MQSRSVQCRNILGSLSLSCPSDTKAPTRRICRKQSCDGSGEYICCVTNRSYLVSRKQAKCGNCNCTICNFILVLFVWENIKTSVIHIYQDFSRVAILTSRQFVYKVSNNQHSQRVSDLAQCPFLLLSSFASFRQLVMLLWRRVVWVGKRTRLYARTVWLDSVERKYTKQEYWPHQRPHPWNF